MHAIFTAIAGPSPRAIAPNMQRNPSLDLTKFVRDIPDFPKPGILFKDITPLLGHTDAFRETIARMADPISRHEDR